MLTWLADRALSSTLGPVHLGRCFDAAVEQKSTRKFNLSVEPLDKLAGIGRLDARVACCSGLKHLGTVFSQRRCG